MDYIYLYNLFIGVQILECKNGEKTKSMEIVYQLVLNIGQTNC